MADSRCRARVRARGWLLVLGAAVVLLAPAPVSSPAWAGPATPTGALPAAPAASPSDEAAFVARVNSLRASHGLSQLQVSGELTSVARAWTGQMAGAGQISHNPQLGSQVSAPWQKLGENVGVGHSIDGLMQAFLDSPSHHRNLVDPAWNYIGVGVTWAADGRLYTTHNFMRLDEPAPPPPPPAATPPPPPPPPAPVAEQAMPAPQPPPPPPPPAPTPEPRPDEQADAPSAGDRGWGEVPSPERVASVLGPLRALEV